MNEHLLRKKIDELNIELGEYKRLLASRAGKLLLKDKPSICIAIDEPYFEDVYMVIRASEKAKGDWTEECEATFLRWCPQSDGAFPEPSEHFAAYMSLVNSNMLLKEVIRNSSTTLEFLNDAMRKSLER